MFWRGWSIARRLFIANLLFAVLIAAGMAGVMVSDAHNRIYEQTGLRMLSVAASLADAPSVIAEASTTNPSAALQPYAEAVMGNAGVDFVTMMNVDGVRWTHPSPEEIGGHYTGSISQARAGQPYTETTLGTLGPSVRAIVPIKDSSGKVLGMVSAGVTVKNVEVLIAARLPMALGLAAALMLAGSLSAWALGRYLKRVTFGWGPAMAQLNQTGYMHNRLRMVTACFLIKDLGLVSMALAIFWRCTSLATSPVTLTVLPSIFSWPRVIWRRSGVISFCT